MEAGFDWSQIAAQPSIVGVVFIMIFFGIRYLTVVQEKQKDIIDAFINKISNDNNNSKQLNEITSTLNHVQVTLVQFQDKVSERIQEVEKDVTDIKVSVASIKK